MTKHRVSVDGRFLGVASVTVDLEIPLNGSVATAKGERALGLWPTLRDADYQPSNRVFASDADTLRILREQL